MKIQHEAKFKRGKGTNSDMRVGGLQFNATMGNGPFMPGQVA